MPEPATVVAAFLLAVVPSALYLVVLNAIDRYEKEPWTFLLAAVGLGAVGAPIVTAVALALLGRPASLPPAFAPGPRPDALLGILEEGAKGLLLFALVHSVRDEFDDVLDGIVYGAAVGAGFGAAESFTYALGGTSFVQGGLPAGTVAALVVAGLNQAFYTAVFGAIVGASQGLARRERALAVALGLATAALLHAFHDTLPLILARLVGQPDAAAGFLSRLAANAVNWLGIATVAVTVVLAWRREARILRAELGDEVATGLVTEADFSTILSVRGRVARQAALVRTGGLRRVLDLRRLYAAEGELAFHKWRRTVRGRRPPDPARADELRALIGRLQESIGEEPR